MTKKGYSRDWAHLASVLSGETDHPETDDRIAGDKNLAKLASLWREMERLRAVGNEAAETDLAWESIATSISMEKAESIQRSANRSIFGLNLRRIAAIAAILIVVAGTGWSIRKLFFTSAISDPVMITYLSGDEKNRKVTLSDGSHVILNSNTRLNYPSYFSGDIREVELEGEAIFTVEEAGSSPFVVRAGGTLVEVLGTTFCITTRINSDDVDVFVESGKVMMKAVEEDGRSLLLEAGQIGMARGAEWEMKINDNQNYLSWNTEVLTFNGETLGEVFIQLHRAYNIEIRTDDLSIEENSITTVFEKLPAEEIVTILCATFNLNYRKDGEVYVLSR